SALRSRMQFPIATPPRGVPAGGENTPNGRFWIGKSAWLRAEATQLRKSGSWVLSSSGICFHPLRSLGAPSASCRVEVTLQVVSVPGVGWLKLRRLGGEARDALREAGLEHEGERAFQLVRREVGVACRLESREIGAVRQHRVVQREPAGMEAAARLGVVQAIDHSHELAHDVQ